MLKDYHEQNEPPKKNGNAPHEGGRNFSARGKGPANGRTYVKKTWPPKKNIKKRTYRKNRTKLTKTHMYQTYPYSLSVCNNTCIEIKDNHNNNDELVILSKQTLTEYQKQVLRKGLNFIPKPKKLNILQIHNDMTI